MKRNFTPAQVTEGKVDYSLGEFLRDLREDVKSNMSEEVLNRLPEGKKRDRKYNEAIREVFNFVCEICYLAVVEKSYLKLVLKQSNEVERKLIKKTIKENKSNIDMLYAILRMHIARGLKEGLTKKQAIKATVEYSKELISKWKR
jgi:hypothetical protein